MSGNLNKLYRVPKLNINLPSGAGFYPSDFITFSIDGSLPIRAMTAKDELMLKSPDALLNGDCLVHIIQSCVPEVKNVRKLLAPDVEAIILGIFHASFGPTLEFKIKCPACGHINEYEVTIREILDSSTKIEFPAVVDIDLGEQDSIPTKLAVYVKPYTFETSTKQHLMLFEHAKLVQVMGNDDTSDEQKIEAFNSSFKKMVDIKFLSVLDSVIKIEIKRFINNETRVEEITNVDEIKEFIFNADKALVDPIIEKIDFLNRQGVNNKFDAICTGNITDEESHNVTINDEGVAETKYTPAKTHTCGHKWKPQLEFNPATFFEKGSSRSARLK